MHQRTAARGRTALPNCPSRTLSYACACTGQGQEGKRRLAGSRTLAPRSGYPHANRNPSRKPLPSVKHTPILQRCTWATFRRRGRPPSNRHDSNQQTVFFWRPSPSTDSPPLPPPTRPYMHIARQLNLLGSPGLVSFAFVRATRQRHAYELGHPCAPSRAPHAHVFFATVHAACHSTPDVTAAQTTGRSMQRLQHELHGCMRHLHS